MWEGSRLCVCMNVHVQDATGSLGPELGSVQACATSALSVKGNMTLPPAVLPTGTKRKEMGRVEGTEWKDCLSPHTTTTTTTTAKKLEK